MKKIITALGVVALGTTLAFGAQNAAPDGGFHGHHQRMGRAHDRGFAFGSKLDLSEAQKTQLKELRKSFREQNADLLETAREAQKQYRDALVAGDTATADALRPKVDSLRDQLIVARGLQRQATLDILTPDQRQQLEQMKNQWQAKRGARRHAKDRQ